MKKTLYIITLLLIGATTATAAVDSQFTTTEPFFVNTGYSKEIYRQTQILKKSPYEPLIEVKDERTLFQKVCDYIDPLSNTNRKYPTHSIEFNNPSINDL